MEHVQRLRVIVGVFLRYGYEPLARRLPLPSPWHLPFRSQRRAQEKLASLTPPERLRAALENLGPTFIKLGQLLSTRAHLLPRAFIVELAHLHDSVPPVPFDQVRTILAAELKRPLAEVFLTIEETPIGSASIAQVHRAVLLTGEKCVIKVQRPGIEKIVRVDLEIMAYLASLLENHVEGWRVHQPTAVVAEFAKSMEQELDFTAEAAHLERFAHQFLGDPSIYIPRLVPGLMTRRVLTMEYIEAVKASDFLMLDAAGLDRRQIATRITDLVMKQIFVHGFFHADPHPGNIHILPGNVICFLDFGMMGFLDQETRQTFARFILSIAHRNEKAAAAALLRLAHAELDPPRTGFEADVAEFMHRHFYRPAGEMVFGPLVNHLFSLTARHNLTLPADLSVMLKALGLMEDLVCRLDPGHDIIGQARPFMRQVLMAQIGPKRLLRHWVDFGNEAAGLARELPMEIRRLMALFKDGRARLHVNHLGLDNLLNTLERIVNRLAFALVLASLIISSSVIVHARVPPLLAHQVSVIGVVGYLLAGLMGFWLLIAMLRHGKM
ncbi:MAG TPA: AarF/ABC1/UbiB kinase family protein [Verrucomicrobiae bacterium]